MQQWLQLLRTEARTHAACKPLQGVTLLLPALQDGMKAASNYSTTSAADAAGGTPGRLLKQPTAVQCTLTSQLLQWQPWLQPAPGTPLLTPSAQQPSAPPTPGTFNLGPVLDSGSSSTGGGCPGGSGKGPRWRQRHAQRLHLVPEAGVMVGAQAEEVAAGEVALTVERVIKV